MPRFEFTTHQLSSIDGDTIRCILPLFSIDWLFPILEDKEIDLGFDIKLKFSANKVSLTYTTACRLEGIDTPETRLLDHRKAGEAVTEAVDLWLNSNEPYRVISSKKGKFSGRFIGNIQHPRGEWWSEYLVNHGLCKLAGKRGLRPTWSKEDLENVYQNAQDVIGANAIA